MNLQSLTPCCLLIDHLKYLSLHAPLPVFCDEFNYIIAVHKYQFFIEMSLKVNKNRSPVKGDLVGVIDRAADAYERSGGRTPVFRCINDNIGALEDGARLVIGVKAHDQHEKEREKDGEQLSERSAHHTIYTGVVANGKHGGKIFGNG